MANENIQLVRRWYEAYGGGRSVDDFFADDAEVWTARGFPEGGPFRGRDQIRSFHSGLREGWKPGAAALVRELEEAGDKVFSSFTWRAVGDASGLEISSDWMAVHTVRDGKFVRVEFFTERAPAINAAGLN